MKRQRPWLSEPSRHYFQSSGLWCGMNRNHSLCWCGYVGIPESHPWHGKNYDWCQPMPSGWTDNYEASVDQIGIMNILCASPDRIADSAPLSLLVRCHHGLTYSGPGPWHNPGYASWWLGFDCGHLDDCHPKYVEDKSLSSLGLGTYRDFSYVKEVLALAAADVAKFGAPDA